MITLNQCPNCGSKRFKKVCKDLHEEYKGQPYTVRALEFQECLDCGERMYGPEAMERIQAVSPAYAKRREKEAKSQARFLKRLETSAHPEARG